MAVSDAQRKATAKYEKKAYVQVRTRFKPNDAQRLYEHAENRNESVNGFINRSVIEQIERDNAGMESITVNDDIIKEDTPNEVDTLPSLEPYPNTLTDEVLKIRQEAQAERDKRDEEEELQRLRENIKQFGV